jgi:hypothetical protein
MPLYLAQRAAEKVAQGLRASQDLGEILKHSNDPKMQAVYGEMRASSLALQATLNSLEHAASELNKAELAHDSKPDQVLWVQTARNAALVFYEKQTQDRVKRNHDTNEERHRFFKDHTRDELEKTDICQKRAFQLEKESNEFERKHLLEYQAFAKKQNDDKRKNTLQSYGITDLDAATFALVG